MFSRAPSVQFNPTQCPQCLNNVENERCRGFVTSSHPRDILGVFETISNAPCPNFETRKTFSVAYYRDMADVIRREGGTAYTLNCKGVAEKRDNIKRAIYYFVAYEQALKESNTKELRQLADNLSFAASDAAVD